MRYEIPPKEGLVVTQFLTVADTARAVGFYTDVLDGTLVRSGDPAIVALANSWIFFNVGGSPTDDKPGITLRPPGAADDVVSTFMNVRVADIHECYDRWSSHGAAFLTEPKEHGSEIRCYMRDPDGYLIEVGQTKG